MDISPIKNQRDYRKVLKEIEGLMSAKRTRLTIINWSRP